MILLEAAIKMVTKTYRFYWYDMTSKTQSDTTQKHTNKTWTMHTAQQCDSYARYYARFIGAFKHELYDERELLKGI